MTLSERGDHILEGQQKMTIFILIKKNLTKKVLMKV